MYTEHHTLNICILAMYYLIYFRHECVCLYRSDQPTVSEESFITAVDDSELSASGMMSY